MKKWDNVSELINVLIDDDDMLGKCEGFIGKAMYAPHIGYGAWVIKYKGTPVCLWDMGNGHYSFYSVVSNIDILIAWLCNRFKWFERRCAR